MDASIATAIIGLLGAAAVGGLGFILQGMRADIQTNGERIGGLGERMGGLGESMSGLSERMGGLGESMSGLSERMGGLGESMSGLSERMGGLGESMSGLSERMSGLSERSARFEEFTLAQFGEVKQVLARIEATQADHGRQFEKLAGDLP